VYFDSNATGGGTIGGFGTPTTLASVTVPAGTYMVDGLCRVIGDNTGGFIECFTTPASPTNQGRGAQVYLPVTNPTTGVGLGSMTTFDVITVSVTTTIQLQADALPAGTNGPYYYGGSRLRVTAVDAVN
jgi:hypothetical protein